MSTALAIFCGVYAVVLLGIVAVLVGAWRDTRAEGRARVNILTHRSGR